MTLVRLAPESTTVTISNTTLNVSISNTTVNVILSTNNGGFLSNNAKFRYANIASTVAGAFGLASVASTLGTKRIRVLGAFLTAVSSGNVYFAGDTAVSTANGVMGNSTAPIAVQAGGGFVLPVDPWGVGWFQTAAGSTGNGPHLNFIATTTGPWAGTVVWTTST